MEEFNKKNENENSDYEFESNNLENDQETEDENYTWYDDEYNPAMSGTVTERNALSLYKPRIKKKRIKGNILAAVISSVVTSAVCFAIFAAAFGVSGAQAPSADNKLSVSNSGNGVIKNVVNSSQGQAMTVPDIYDKVSPSVVSIVCSSGGNNSQSSSGSGVIITADGYISTNNHVIDGASIITVKTIAGQSFTAQVVGKDARTDIAVLKISSEQELPYAEIGDSAALRVGDIALAIGNPLQEELVSTLTVGYISAIDRTMIIDERQMTMLQTDAAINPGNSGGALINIYGQVIGITTAKATGYDVEGLGFAIPMNEAVPIIESIIKNGYVTGRPLVGITGIDVTAQIAAVNDLPEGVYVDTVISGGAADLGGIKEGDVITKFDGKEVKSVDEINSIRDSHKVGDKINVVVKRNGTTVKCIITLQEEKPSSDETKNSDSNSTNKGGYQYFPHSDFFSFFGW